MEDKLKQKYGLGVALSMVVGVVIGVGIFFKTGSVLKDGGMDFTILILAWILGTIFSILGGLTIAEVASSIPKTGGIITWIEEIYGKFRGFVVGRVQTIFYIPAVQAIVSYYFAYFTLQFLGIENSPLFLGLIAFGALSIVFVFNTFTKKQGGKLQLLMTIIKLLPILAIIIFGLFFSKHTFGIENIDFVKTVSSPGFFKLLGIAIIPIMFAFDGWIYVTTISGDIKNPQKNLPKSIILGLGFIGVVYILFSMALVMSSNPQIVVEEGVFGVAKILFGDIGAKIIMIAIMISAFGGVNGFFLAGSRIPYSLSLKKQIPFSDKLSKVSQKYNQPLNSSILVYVLNVIYLIVTLLLPNPDTLSEITVGTIWLFYSLAFLGVIILRKKKPNIDRPYKVLFYPFVPILATISGIAIAVYSTIAHPMYMLYSLIVIVIGSLIFFLRKK